MAKGQRDELDWRPREAAYLPDRFDPGDVLQPEDTRHMTPGTASKRRVGDPRGPILREEEHMPETTKADEYRRGFIDAMTCFAIWRRGEQVVGAMWRPLKYEIESIADNVYYQPPKETE